MKTRALVKGSAFTFAFALAGCGGGNGDRDGSAAGASISGGTRLLPTQYTSDGRALNSCSFNPICSGNPHAPFIVVSSDPAPPDGSVLSGVVRLQARGIEIANAELLPGSGHTPRRGVYGLSRDKTTGWLDFDTTMLPNGPVTVRMSGFNVGPGQPGAVEMVGMSSRTWTINNPPLPAGFSAGVTSAPAAGASVSGIRRIELRGAGIANAELLPASGYTPRHGQFSISADKTYAWLDFDTRALPDGAADLRVSAYNVTMGQPGSSEIIAMQPRRWNVANSSNGSFSAHVTTAPMHGSQVTGRITIELHGTGIRNAELLPANGYTPVYGNFTESFDGTFAFLDLDTRNLPNGVLNVRVSAFNVLPGQPGAREIVVMPARQWRLRN